MNDQLLDYIHTHLQQGNSPAEIRQILLQYGWDEAAVQQAFDVVSSLVPAVSHEITPVTLSGSSPADAMAAANTGEADVQKPRSHPDNWFSSDQGRAAYAAPDGTAVANTAASQAVERLPKYRVFRAIADYFQAVRGNAVAYFVTMVVSAIMSGVLLIPVILVYIFIGTQSTGAFLHLNASYILLLIVGFLVSMLWAAASSAFLGVTASVTLRDGFLGQRSAIKAVLTSSIQRVPRVLLANALFALVIVGPYLAGALVGMLLLVAKIGGTILPIIVLAAVAIGGLVWGLIAAPRYMLAPMVAIFEPQLPIKQTLARSKQLMAKGGQWFVVKGIALLLVLTVGMLLITGNKLQQIQNSSSIVIVLVDIALTLVTNGVVVMLYLNRSAVKSRETVAEPAHYQ